MTRPVLLDLFCGAGGAVVAHRRAGFDVVGVDCEPQPNYPFGFEQDDALLFLARQGAAFDAIHASPPCQAGLAGLKAANRAQARDYDHVDLVPETRELIRLTRRWYVIEQPMQGARLLAPAVYCGSSFGLPIRRHRQFESDALLLSPQCEHDRLREKKYWTGWVRNGERQRATVVQVYGNGGEREQWGPALGVDWMTPDELTQAIPPAYTEHVGRQLLAALGRAAQ